MTRLSGRPYGVLRLCLLCLLLYSACPRARSSQIIIPFEPFDTPNRHVHTCRSCRPPCIPVATHSANQSRLSNVTLNIHCAPTAPGGSRENIKGSRYPETAKRISTLKLFISGSTSKSHADPQDSDERPSLKSARRLSDQSYRPTSRSERETTPGLSPVGIQNLRISVCQHAAKHLVVSTVSSALHSA